MTSDQVIEIMGKPDELKLLYEGNDTLYYYHPPFAASSGIDVYIRNDTVYLIGLYEWNIFDTVI